VNSRSILLTDLYQLTMAYSYWKTGIHERPAVFHLYFRKAPFESGFAIAAGLSDAIEFLRDLHFTGDDLEYLRSLKLFDAAFLEFLRAFRFTCDVDAVAEGTAVFANEPLLRVKGPILQSQIVETALLNAINFQTLVATKAARIVHGANGKPVLEFGLRRAQGADGGVTASRAAYIGGCAGTSNVLAGRRFGIPVAGTHAHSWVMAFENEKAAFEAYARAMPDNALFLVDTYDTMQGVRHAIEIGRKLRSEGKTLRGVRIDSGDLAWLSIGARRLLDEAGFTEAKIVASNDLDEHIIASLESQQARIDMFGVGTRLATAWDQPALGGVYKLGALYADGRWQRRIKVSEQSAKTTIPGILQVRRYTTAGEVRGDMIWDELDGQPKAPAIVDPADPTRRKSLAGCDARDLLVPIVRDGLLVYEVPSISASRENTLRELSTLDPGVKRLENPHGYPVGLEQRLHDRRVQMIFALREAA
jgi:nicotinate phosphoribosyltransferase